MLNAIVTHPGGAHKDDFLACCVLLTQADVAIHRREPSLTDLDDAAIAVVDIGHQHSPALHNFDHHQLPRDQVPTCALSLVLQHLGLYEDARQFCDWLETSEWLDCRGPIDTAAWLGAEREILAKLNSPIDVTVLRRFANQSTHRPGEPIWEVMRMIGEDLVAYISGLRAHMDFIAEHAELWELEGQQALFLPRTDPLPEEPSAGLGRYIQQKELSDSVLAIVYPDRRGSGYGLRRFNDSAELDFTQLQEEADVHFTHARGFIAKTSATDSTRLKALLHLALQR
jgi:hypothetical protein